MEAFDLSMSGSAAAYEKARRELRHRFADNLRCERARLDLTQERLAERVGFSLQYVQRIEREIVNVPLDTVARFAHAFHVDPSTLFSLRASHSTLIAAERQRRYVRSESKYSRRKRT